MWPQSPLPPQRVSNRSVQGRSPRGRQRLCFQDENNCKQVTLTLLLAVYLRASQHSWWAQGKARALQALYKRGNWANCPTSHSAQGNCGPGDPAACHGARTRSLERQETRAGLPTPLHPTSTSRGRNAFSAPSREVSTPTELGYRNVFSFSNLVIQDGQSSWLICGNTGHIRAWGPLLSKLIKMFQ